MSVLALTWSTPAGLTFGPDADFQPDLLQAREGRVWLFWQLWNTSSRNMDIFYKFNDGTQWSLQYRLTSDPAQDITPSVAQLSNGTMVVAWSSNRTGNFEIFLKRYQGNSWSGDLRVTDHQGDDYTPSLLAMSDGSLWLFWMRRTPAGEDIFLKTYGATGWSSDTPLITDAGPDRSPSAVRLKDGRILLVWARGTAPSEQAVFYSTYAAGVWSSQARLTETGQWDGGPEVVQDRDGTVWVFWSRKFPYTEPGVSGHVYQDEIMYSLSTDSAQTWAEPFRLTDDPNGSEKNDSEVTVVQGRDRRLWMAFSSDPEIIIDPDNSFSYWEIYASNSQVILTHDLAVTKVASGTQAVAKGVPATITVTIANLGDYSESRTLTVYAGPYLIETRSIVLAANTTSIVQFQWNTSSYSLGVYSLSANVTGGLETLGNLGDNSATGGTVRLVLPGDIDVNGVVNILDAALVAYSYGSGPGDPMWNPNADINGSGRIDIIDAAILAFWYGTSE